MNTNKKMTYGKVKSWYKEWSLVSLFLGGDTIDNLLHYLEELSRIKIHIMDMKNKIESSKIHSYFCVLHGQVLYLIEKIKYLIRAKRDLKFNECNHKTYVARLKIFQNIEWITTEDYPMIYVR